MRRMIKRMTAAAVASGLAVSLSMTALAEEIGPGFETPAAEIIDGPRFPGDTEYMNEEPENGSQAGESSGQEGRRVKMDIRGYVSPDCRELAELFYGTVGKLGVVEDTGSQYCQKAVKSSDHLPVAI